VAFAGLERFSVHDAPLMGGFRAGGGHWLWDGVPWQRYPEFDLLLFTAIPHCAMGAENCYAMVEYVKAGGAVMFTGGEYAFGKGGYNYTVLERELLPVLCAENVDTRYAETPLPIEPANDFDELKAKVDFGARPSFWVWNQVALKSDPAVKVFLRSGNRPVLVGWQVGKGRVACLLVDHRGKSEKDVTAFFDWADWPVLLRAVVAWLAPDALQTQAAAAPALSAGEARKLLDQLEGDAMEDAAAGLDEGTAAAGRKPAKSSKKDRVALIERALQGRGAEIAAALAEQLATVSDLPLDTRFRILDFVRAQPPPKLAGIARRCCESKESPIRGCGMQILALAGDAAFPKEMTGPAPGLETDPQGRTRDLALALVLYSKPDLVDEGRRRLQAWNARENEVMRKWTDSKGFSPAAPEHSCLDAEALFQRVAWLAYLSRHDAKAAGAQFAREWLMTAQYQDYCDRSARNLWSDHMTAVDKKRAEVKGQEWQRFRTYFGRLRELTRPDIEALVKQSADLAAEGFVKAHFTLEFRTCMNVLGSFDRQATSAILERLRKADNADLAEFAASRAATR
ncbi:MAG: glutamine amidotransferase, partial [Planctomycetota bacterium]|nr:glutamine amidotransferase [Planctomycetota bacterium]